MHKNKLVGLFTIILLIGSSLTVPATVIYRTSLTECYEKTLYVGGSGPGNYTKIQDAIDDAFFGDTVFVYDDSSPYYENLKISKSIELIGENRNTTIIDGNDKQDVVQINSIG